MHADITCASRQLAPSLLQFLKAQLKAIIYISMYLIKTNKPTFSDSRKSDKTTGCMRRPVLVCQWDKICLISWVVSYFINAEIVIASLTE